MSEGSPVVPGGFVPGSRIAGYLLEEQIGQGGMAVVFRAHDERLDRTVALKILAPALASDVAFRQRFMRESRAAAAVDDPHIIPVFEAGEASGVLFIAMRWVRGGDVRSLVGRLGPMAPGRAADIISQVASALDAAHTRGLVHRDVKPANMLLDASSGSGRPDHVYLSDFGLSKGSLQTSSLTGTGTFLGTLDYISPEQIEGKPVDGRTDEYALACASFELLTGAPPFQRDEAMAVMYAQLSEPPPALSSRRRGLPFAVDDVFIKALAKAPADRYPTCSEFAEALRLSFGLRPYDSGPGAVPSGGHPATRIVRPSDPAAGSPGTAGPGAVGTGAAGAGLAGAAGVGAAAAGAADYATNRGPEQGLAPGQGGPTEPGRAGGARAAGDDDGTATQLAGDGRRTEPDQTVQQRQQEAAGGVAGPPGYGQYGGSDPEASIVRPWWKSPLALVATVVVLIGGGAAAYALTKSGGGGGVDGGGTNNGHRAVALKAPDCSTAAAHGRNLPTVPAVKVPNQGGKPFGIAVSKDGKAVFVVTDTLVEVFRTGAGGSLTATGAQYQVSSSKSRAATSALVTPSGRYLLVAVDDGILVLDAAKAESGEAGATIGMLSVPDVSGYGRAVGVAVTPDDRYAFVALQFADKVGMFNLARALSGHFNSAYVGSLDVGPQPVGVAVSPDGQTLYATNFVADAAVPGKLTVIDIAKVTSKKDLQRAIIGQALAGCHPARIAVTPDNRTVWVTTRQSNFLLGYSASLLRTNPAKALIAKVRVGQWPIGIILVNGGRRIVISDNDGVPPPQTEHNLAVVDPSAALAGKQALLGYIPSGLTPREFAMSPDGKFLYVTNRDSSQIQVINLSKLP